MKNKNKTEEFPIGNGNKSNNWIIIRKHDDVSWNFIKIKEHQRINIALRKPV